MTHPAEPQGPDEEPDPDDHDEDMSEPDEPDDDQTVEKGEDVHTSWQPGFILPGFDPKVFASINPLLERFRKLGTFAAANMFKDSLPRWEFDIIPPETRAALQQYINETVAPLRESLMSVVDWSRFIRPLFDPAIFAPLREALAERIPPNWEGLEDWYAAATFVDETGWPIVWLPRAEVVSKLLAAAPEDREDALLGAADHVVEDAIALAAEVTADDLGFVAECIVEIASSTRAGRHRAAQALAGSVLTELIQGALGHPKLADACAAYKESWRDQSFIVLRFALITSTIPRALDRFFRDKGDPVPSSFNRHAVAHGANPVQFTPLNALVGLLLVSSLTRELQELYDEDVLDEAD